ncbi:MAG: hypothetical protein HRK26_00665 [Rickettsiaceae bacterium H1]|nr:hypothetical protein [Rickettsiaceae bacterium H1]
MQESSNFVNRLKESIDVNQIQSAINNLEEEKEKIDNTSKLIVNLEKVVGVFLEGFENLDLEEQRKRAEEVNKNTKQVIRQINEYVKKDENSKFYYSEESLLAFNNLKETRDNLQASLDNFNKEYKPNLGQKIEKSALKTKEKAVDSLKSVIYTIRTTFESSSKALGNMREALGLLLKGKVSEAKEELSKFNESFKSGNLASKVITGTIMAAIAPVLVGIGVAAATIGAGLVTTTGVIGGLLIAVKDAVHQTGYYAGKMGKELVNKLEISYAEKGFVPEKLTPRSIADSNKRGLERQQYELNLKSDKLKSELKTNKVAFGEDGKPFSSEDNSYLNKKISKYESMIGKQELIKDKISSKKEKIERLEKKGKEIKEQEKPRTGFESLFGGLKEMFGRDPKEGVYDKTNTTKEVLGKHTENLTEEQAAKSNEQTKGRG